MAWKTKGLLCLLIVLLLCQTACGKTHSNRIKEANDAQISQKENWKETPERLVVTSMATAYLMEKLELDLVGIPDSEVDKTPAVYKDAVKVGSAMTPDMEIIRSLQPTYVFSPVSLVGLKKLWKMLKLW